MRKAKKRKHSPIEIDNAWRMKSEGWKYDAIAAELRISYWTLMDWWQFKTQAATNQRAAKKWGLA